MEPRPPGPTAGPSACSDTEKPLPEALVAPFRQTPQQRERSRLNSQGDLDAFLRDPDRRWDGGPFSEAARRLLVPRTADLAQLAKGFDRLVDATIPARADPVITHGEPHPANVMSVDGRLMLIDWDTAGRQARGRPMTTTGRRSHIAISA